jgi:hypothetical protein
MKTISSHFAFQFLLAITGCLLATAAFAEDTNKPAHHEHRIYTKIPWAVGFGMEGTVTNITLVDERIHFQFTGWFWLDQYPWGGTNQQVIKVDARKGISATLTPTEFVAMTSDWGGGSVVNDKTKLIKILNTAAKRGTVVKFSLMQPKMDFGTNGFTLLDAKVWRITDADLH